MGMMKMATEILTPGDPPEKSGEFGGAARSLGVKSLLSSNFQGEKPSYVAFFGEHWLS